MILKVILSLSEIVISPDAQLSAALQMLFSRELDDVYLRIDLIISVSVQVAKNLTVRLVRVDISM